jgi:hypothetical protein
MTITAISSTPSITTLDPTTGTSSSLPSTLQAIANNFNALGAALQSGDLSGAQQAFTSLLQSAPTTAASSTASQSSASSGSSASSSAGADLVSLGQALQSGNLAGAQQAFANLQQAMQAAAPAGGHHHGGGAGKVGGGTSGGAASGSATTVTSQVTTPNANGTVTITTTYADGSTSTTIEQNPAASTNTATNTKPLDQRNAAQLLTLLGAQEQTQPT